jgi:CheY-like chemotaxis protein
VRIFISSVIGGYEPFRAAAAEALETLGHQVVRAEDFPASAATPQQACLAAVRESDMVVLLIGSRYGAPQPSGLSATHEEHREARERKPMLVFVESGVEREEAQQAFLDEVEAWATGHYRASYSTPEDLRRALIRAVHDHELATSVGPVDEGEMIQRAKALLPQRNGPWGGAQLGVAVAAGPQQQVIRPARLGDAALVQEVHQQAAFGDHPVLDPTKSTDRTVRGSSLLLDQRSAMVRVDEDGSIYVAQPARPAAGGSATELPALIEEDIAQAIGCAIRFAGWLLDHIDPLRRLTDVVVIAQTVGAGYMPWRTKDEHAASPNSATMGQGNDTVALLSPARRPRQALTLDADRLTQDLMALLRRGHRT